MSDADVDTVTRKRSASELDEERPESFVCSKDETVETRNFDPNTAVAHPVQAEIPSEAVAATPLTTGASCGVASSVNCGLAHGASVDPVNDGSEYPADGASIGPFVATWAAVAGSGGDDDNDDGGLDLVAGADLGGNSPIPPAARKIKAKKKNKRRRRNFDAENSSLPSRQACLSEPFQRRFNDMLYELLKFRVQKNHVRVPTSFGMLGAWVYRIRVQYLALQREPSRTDLVDLTQERVDVLNSLDFCWDLQKFETDRTWIERFQELLQWREVHGNCNVPQSNPLGKWVKMQRDYYNNTQNGKTNRKGSLTQEKIEKLESIGFEWRLLKMVGWDKRFEELCEWKKIHGHTNVPTQTCGSLGRWVSKQRIQLTYRKNGEYSQLSDDRIEKLNSIGFVWNTKVKCENTEGEDEAIEAGLANHHTQGHNQYMYLPDALQL